MLTSWSVNDSDNFTVQAAEPLPLTTPHSFLLSYSPLLLRLGPVSLVAQRWRGGSRIDSSLLGIFCMLGEADFKRRAFINKRLITLSQNTFIGCDGRRQSVRIRGQCERMRGQKIQVFYIGCSSESPVRSINPRNIGSALIFSLPGGLSVISTTSGDW